jgi:hypothetical protein
MITVTRRIHFSLILTAYDLSGNPTETVAIYTAMKVESLRQVSADCHPAEKSWQEINGVK